jgi:hypothetical protein
VRRNRGGSVAAAAGALGGLLLAGCASGTAPRDSNVTAGSATVTTGGSGVSARPTGSSGTTGSIEQLVPADVLSVHIVLGGAPEGSGSDRTVTGATARRLAAVVTEQPAAQGAGCMADTGTRDQLTFLTASSVVRVIVKPDPCGSVTVGQTRLTGAATVERAARAALR